MDWLTFASKIVSAIAWPVATLSIVIILREPIFKILNLVSRIKVSDVELEFDRQLSVAKEEASIELRNDELKQIGLPTPIDNHYVKLAEVSPRAAVMESWRHVEAAALNAAKIMLNRENFSNKTMTFQAINIIEKSGVLPERIVLLLRQLRSLRNQAAHAPEFSLSASLAIEYVQLASQVIAFLEGLANKTQ
jgi:uncharacterized protein YutE (UPF0331/DUF86 family)